MTTLNKIEVNGKGLIFWSARTNFAGHGHYKITVELEYKDKINTFYSKTTNMQSIDNASDIEDYDEKQMFLYQIIANNIEEEIINWMNEVDEAVN